MFFKQWKELGINNWIVQHSQRKMSEEESMQTDWRSAEWLVGSIEVQLFFFQQIFMDEVRQTAAKMLSNCHLHSVTFADY